MKRRGYFLALFLVAFVLLPFCGIGCSNRDGLVPVEGEVSLDGRSVDRAMVLFIPEAGDGLPAHGFTDEGGNFWLTTDSRGEGALPGEYKVLVIRYPVGGQVGFLPAESAPPDQLLQKQYQSYLLNPAGTPPKSLLPERYATEATTPLKVKVPTAGKVRLELTSRSNS